MSRTDRKHPTLPQNDDPSEQKKRARDIADARSKYTWTTEVATLPGVPLAKSVPFADEPSIPWLITLVKAALPVVENAVANAVDEKESAVRDDVAAELDRIREEVAEIEENHTAAANPAESLEEGVEGVFDAVKGAVGKLFGNHRQTLLDHVDRLQELRRSHSVARDPHPSLEDYAALFVELPEPAIVGTFMEDATFCRMRVAGPNPTLLAAVTDVPDNAPEAASDRLASAASAGRLFAADYAQLGSIVAGTMNGLQQYLWCPIAYFEVPEGSGTLQAVGIQLGQEPDSAWVEPPTDGSTDYAWEMAKFAVQVADGNDHELFAHLARTHLVLEAFTLATRRNLAPQHPLSVLLAVHFQGTLFINNSAAGSLIAEGGPIDQIFAGTIDTTQLAAANDRLGYEWTLANPHRSVEARGVGPDSVIADYPWRDDALSVYDAIRDWVEAYVAAYYTSDEDVVGDTELAAWSAELAGIGKVKGFRAPTTRRDLVGTLATVIFDGSAQHAAVNFPQRDLMSYAPNVTGAAWAAATGDDPTRATWVDMMPPIDLASEQLTVLSLLGGVHFGALGDYKNPDFPYDSWFLDEHITRSDGPLDRFRVALREVEATIEKRNAERDVAYPYLLPTLIPQSINI